MTITDYASLKSAVADLSNRSDLTSVIPLFIQLAENKLDRSVRRTAARAQYIFNDETWTMPATIKELLSIRLVTGSPALDLPIPIVTPEVLAEMRAVELDTAGRPTMASIIGRDVLFDVTPDQAYTGEVTYVAAISTLSDSTTTNTILSQAPDLYLYYTMVELENYLEHDDRAAMWQARGDKALADYNLLREREEYGASLRPGRLSRTF